MREFLAEHWDDIVGIAYMLGMFVFCYLFGRADKKKGEVWLTYDSDGKLMGVAHSSNIVVHYECMPKEGGAR